jgi:hypothetical protein
MREGLPERLHRLRFRLNPWARARQYRTERDAYKRWLHDCESRGQVTDRRLDQLLRAAKSVDSDPA